MTKYSKYESYKETSFSHIGVVPAHWDLKRTKFLFERQNRPPRECDETVTAFRDGQVTLRINRRTEGFTQSLKEIGYQGVRCGDLVVHAMDGFAGAIGVSDSDGKCSPVYSICKPIEGVANSKYYGLYLRNLALDGYVESLAKGIRERSTEFRYAELKEVWLPEPPVAEQLQIANFLDHETAKIDNLIDKQQQLIKLLKEKRQAIISHAVTKGLNPDVPMKDSGVEWLGEVPEHWKVLHVRRMIRAIEQGKSPECENRLADLDEWAVLKTGCVNGGVFRGDEHKALPEGVAPHVAYEVKENDLLMSRASGSVDLIGSVAYVEKTRSKLLLSDKVFRLFTNKNVCKKYLWILMNSPVVRVQIELAINGAEGLANNITKQSILSFQVALPPIDEQEEIVAKVLEQANIFDRLIAKSGEMIALLLERRTALISAAVTGKIDLRNWELELAEDQMENIYG